MRKIFMIFILSFFFSCTQESAEIIYRNNSVKKNRNSTLKPSYMKGTYVENNNKELVRDLKKNYSGKEQIGEDIEDCGKIVVVGKGDSLLRIARKCGCLLNDMASINNLKPPYNVYVGQKLKTNCKINNVNKDNKKHELEYKVLTVEKGQTLIHIAIDNNCTLREVATLNSINPPYNLYIGQKIKVPIKNNNFKEEKYSKNSENSKTIKINNKTSIINDNNIYVVKKGDTIYSIAKKNDVNFSDLVKNNNLKKPYNIFVGQKLKLSASSNNSTKNSFEQKNRDKSYSNQNNNKLERFEEDTKVKSKNETLTREDSKILVNGNSMFIWPVKGDILKKFGKQEDGSFNDAINIKSEHGTKVKAADNGEVAYAGNELKGFGNIIIIKHKNGWLTVYGHCDSINVKVKDKVEKGQVIATVGKTGNVNESQLYFSLRKGRTAMDPLKYLTNN